MTIGRSRRRIWLAVAGVLLASALLFVAVAVFGPAGLYGIVSRVVVVADELEPADLIYVLNGRIETRADEAARVYHKGFAAVIRIAHTREMARRPDRPLSEVIAAEIVRRGVPRSAVEIVPFPDGVADTRDEGRALRKYLETNPVGRVIVVTTDHHTGRARRTLAQELRGLTVELLMSGAPDGRGITPENWWTSEAGRRVYGEELAKQLGVLLRIEREHLESLQ